MERIQKLFLLLTVIGPLHMGEQLLTDIEEFHMIKRAAGSYYYSRFSDSDADWASVLLITIVWTACSLMLYAFLIGGRARLLVLALFGAFAVSEIHHVVEALGKGAYDAGVITCVPYAWAGVLLLSAVWHELRRGELFTIGRAESRALGV